jgi:hypothetical protein
MKLTQIAAKPTLVRIVLDDEEIRSQYNDELEFWIYDRQPMEQFVRLAQMKSEDFQELVETINKMVLDEDGTPIVKDGVMLPTNIMTKVIGRVVETLGK